MRLVEPDTPGGVFVDRQLREMIRDEIIVSPGCAIEPDQVQPNSLDLRVGPKAFRIRASFLPIDSIVEHRLQSELSYEIDLTGDGQVLEPDAVYLVPLLEELHLPPLTAGKINPKSSTGRLDIFCRAVTNRARAFDEIEHGYRGPLYLEVVPRSFQIRLREGDRLAQVRLFEGEPIIRDDELKTMLGDQIRIFDSSGSIETPLRDGLHFSVNLKGTKRGQTIGYSAKPAYVPIDIRAVQGHPIRDYWEWIKYEKSSDVILRPGMFYIFASYERLKLGPMVCAEMLPYDAGMGEVRSHYAGFFDSGFGLGEGKASRIVLEVRNYHVPYRLSHRQTLFRVRVMRNLEEPDELYGAPTKGSHYQGQELRLAKQFYPRAEPEELPLFPEYRDS